MATTNGNTAIPVGGTNNDDGLNDEERKKRAMGILCYNILGLVSTAAFICGVYSYAQCNFLTRYITLTEEYADDTSADYTQACNDLGYGSMNSGLTANGMTGDAGTALCSSLLQNHGIGFSYWQATIPVDQKVCFPYTQLTPWGYVVPEFDAAFVASRTFSIFGYVFGGAAWFTLTCSSCCRIDQTRLKGIACYFWLATLFQGLSLLMFNSKVCDAGFFSAYFVNPSQQSNQTAIDNYQSILQDVQCELALGSKMAISATVLYLLCSLMVPFAIVPMYQYEYYSDAATNSNDGNNSNGNNNGNNYSNQQQQQQEAQA